ncbi:hypothetical protein, partial [Rathayibacter tritici]|uniref:hypothetical protein n=1 Tax=Rathayibacter tritici TaxID=33888 RepID=UPI0015E1D0D9
ALKVAKTTGLLGQANKFADFAKPIITDPSRTTSALDWLKNQIGAGGVTVSNEFTPSILPRIDPLPRIDLRKAEVRRLDNADLRGDPRFEAALEDRNNAQTKLDQATTARNQVLTELRELGIDIDPRTLKKKDIGRVIRSHRKMVRSADLSNAEKNARLRLLKKLEKRSFEEREDWTARNNSSRDLGEKAAAAYREALGDTEVLNRPNAMRDRFDLITRSPDRTRLTFTEAKGGDAKLSSTGRKVDGESAAQGSMTYFNDLFQKDPEFRAWLDENPGVLEKLQKGEIKIEYQMVRARPDGTVEVFDLVLDQSALELK